MRIDINADLGEGFGFDDIIMPLISSCSIACGGHIGDEGSIRKTVHLAKKHDIKVGVHPSFPDKVNFGRNIISIDKEILINDLVNQLQVFHEICKEEEVEVNHIKLHGALYNLAAIDLPTAEIVLEAIKITGVYPQLYVMPNSVLHKKATGIVSVKQEAFIDRRYNENGSLVKRSIEGAVIVEPEEAWAQFYEIAMKKQVTTINDTIIPLEAQTFCVHGDNINSVAILKYIRSQMKNHNIELQ